MFQENLRNRKAHGCSKTFMFLLSFLPNFASCWRYISQELTVSILEQVELNWPRGGLPADIKFGGKIWRVKTCLSRRDTHFGALIILTKFLSLQLQIVAEPLGLASPNPAHRLISTLSTYLFSKILRNRKAHGCSTTFMLWSFLPNCATWLLCCSRELCDFAKFLETSM